jgi:hypothetical protein
MGLWVVLLLGVFAFQAIFSMVQKSPTWDETAHLPAGYSYLVKGDYRMNPEHPPLAKMLAGAPLLFLHLNGAFDTEAWWTGNEWRYGWELLYHQANDASRIFLWGRLPMVCLALGLGLLIFLWARRIYGKAAGLLALFLYAFSPDFIAHGTLTNTDVPVSFFFVLSLFCFEWALQKTTFSRSILAGAALGLALLTKFSALLTIPTLGMIAAARLRETPGKLRATALLFVLMLAAAYGVIWTGYGFRFSAVPGQDSASLWFPQQVNQVPGPLYGFLHNYRLLPQAFLEGFRYVGSTLQRECYLDGENNPGWGGATPGAVKRWPQYFFITFFYKTPIPVLIILAVAVWFSIKSGRKLWNQEMPIVIGAILYFAFAVYSNMNIGNRLILPTVALLLVFASQAVNHLRLGNWFRPALIALVLLWHAAGTIGVFPNYLAYFNELAGGPGNGPRHLTDSNIDWGQDLILLKRYIDRHGIREVNLSYFGSADPRYYGIKARFLPGETTYPVDESELCTAIRPGEYLAISVTNLKETYAPLPDFIAAVKERTPIAKIGYSIYLYRY